MGGPPRKSIVSLGEYSISTVVRFQSNGVRPLFFFRSLCVYSSSAAAVAVKPRSNFFADYLINSLGFSEQEALSVVSKRPLHRCYGRDPSIVVSFLEQLGLKKNQIKSIVSADHRVLSYNVDKTLKPKIRVFQDLGISGSDLIGVIMHYKCLLCKGRSSFVPAIEYLRKLLGTDENVAAAIKRFTPLLDSYVASKIIPANVELLRGAGFSNEDVTKFVVSHPMGIIRKPEQFEEVLRRVENEFGISRRSKMFYRGVVTVTSSTQTKINSKLEAFRSYGWSYADIYRLIRTLPVILNRSDAKIREALSFYMEELGYTPDYVASRPALLTYSLEGRVKPRREVLKVLNGRKSSKRNLSLYRALCLPESQFVKAYIHPYENELPDLYESYMKSVGR